MTENAPVWLWGRLPAGLRLLLMLAAVASLVTGVVKIVNRPPREHPAAAPVWAPAPLHGLAGQPGMPGPNGDAARRTLILYTATGASANMSHSDAMQTANLASCGGQWTMQPVERYRSGDLAGYQAVIYLGRYSTVPLPAAFLADVANGETPVLWMGDNIGQLFMAEAAATADYGWRPGGIDNNEVSVVEYDGRRLERRTGTRELMNRVELTSDGQAVTLGIARHADGSGYPWAVRARNLTYVGEVPFSYVDTKDRYLAAADLIQQLVAPDAPDRKRALIRIEDVGPKTDPQQIRRIADSLASRQIPFSIATFPYYRDPRGVAQGGEPSFARLVDSPELVSALQYARERNGTIIMHGYTHQYGAEVNPYDGTSGSDFEFYAAHVDAENYVRLDGPLPEDSRQWAAERLAVGRGEFAKAGLPDPAIFEFPHYTASAASYQAVNEVFGVRYDQGTYFSEQCPDGQCSTTDVPGPAGLFQQYFPYPVRDVYGSVVIPENLGNVAEAFNNNAARTPADLIEAASAVGVVGDSVASAFFHPFLPLSQLEAIVDGVQREGFRFVSPGEIALADVP